MKARRGGVQGRDGGERWVTGAKGDGVREEGLGV